MNVKGKYLVIAFVVIITSFLVIRQVKIHYPLMKVRTDNIIGVEAYTLMEVFDENEKSLKRIKTIYEIELDEGIYLLETIRSSSKLKRGSIIEVYFLSGLTVEFTYEDGSVLSISEQIDHYAVHWGDYRREIELNEVSHQMMEEIMTKEK